MPGSISNPFEPSSGVASSSSQEGRVELGSEGVDHALGARVPPHALHTSSLASNFRSRAVDDQDPGIGGARLGLILMNCRLGAAMISRWERIIDPSSAVHRRSERPHREAADPESDS